MKETLFFLLLAVTAYSHGDIPSEYACPHSWTQRSGYCYRYFKETLPWSKAETTCLEHFDSKGIAHLVSIHDQAENDFVYEIFKSGSSDLATSDDENTIRTNLPTSMWIGLHQEVSDGPWVWSDGSPNDFTHWLPGQPDNGYHARGRPSEDCVTIWENNDGYESTRQWDDIGCDRQGGMAFVCKIPAVPEYNDVGGERLDEPIW